MERSNRIKNYINSVFAKEDQILVEIKERAKKEGIPSIHVPPGIGKLLYCLTKIHSPQKILEIGTLAGYSTIWIARALSENARMISLEINPEYVAIANKHLAFANLDKKVEVRIGRASDLMDHMIVKNEGPFDLVFIDADKKHYPLYFEKALRLSRSGSLILCDNLIPKNEEIYDPQSLNPEPKGAYQFNQMIATHPRIESILVPTIGSERLDAFGIFIVR